MLLGTLRTSSLRCSVRPAASMLVRPTAALGLRHIGGAVPQPPGGIVGTVNEAAKLPEPNRVHGSYHWSFERIVAVSLVPLTILPFANSMTPVLDAILGSVLIVHSHIGLESCIIDYIPARVYGVWHKVAKGALWGGSALALYGLYDYETNDVGITETIRKVWNA